VLSHSLVVATVLALSAAVLHAGWNLAAKTSTNRFGLLWAQFLVAGVIGSVVLAFVGWPGNRAAVAALASAVVHVPYVALLARGYDSGDLSLVYPVGRGAGAAGAAIGGVVVLHERFSPIAWVGLACAACAIVSFADRGVPRRVLALAFGLAASIATYSVIDASGSRHAISGLSYAAVGFIASATTISLYGLATHRTSALASAWRAERVRAGLAGVALLVTYGMVLIAFRYAKTGYVTILRESSVLLAVVAGQRLLNESMGRRRLLAALGVVAGLGLVVAGSS
jgi:multidrug transporter EmrE-like cation transporter